MIDYPYYRVIIYLTLSLCFERGAGACCSHKIEEPLEIGFSDPFDPHFSWK